jgi:hypothetical protein
MVATHILDVHNEKERHQLEEELHIEILPGTEIMADFGSHHFVKQTGSKGPVLVPQPSNNPNDPLNWTRRRKFVVIAITNLFSFTLGFGPLAIAPQFPALMEAFDASLPDVVQFVSSLWFFVLMALDRCLHSSIGFLKFPLGSNVHQLWSTICLHLEFSDMSCELYLARTSNDVCKLHGRMCSEWYRRWSC